MICHGFLVQIHFFSNIQNFHIICPHFFLLQFPLILNTEALFLCPTSLPQNGTFSKAVLFSYIPVQVPLSEAFWNYLSPHCLFFCKTVFLIIPYKWLIDVKNTGFGLLPTIHFAIFSVCLSPSWSILILAHTIKLKILNMLFY